MKLRNHFPVLLFLNGTVPFLFTDLRNSSVDKPKPWFASSISKSANCFFCCFFFEKKNLFKGLSDGQRSLSHLCLTCSVDFFMLSPHIRADFLALIPPFSYFSIPLRNFQIFQIHSSSHNSGICIPSRFNFYPSGYT